MIGVRSVHALGCPKSVWLLPRQRTVVAARRVRFRARRQRQFRTHSRPGCASRFSEVGVSAAMNSSPERGRRITTRGVSAAGATTRPRQAVSVCVLGLLDAAAHEPCGGRRPSARAIKATAPGSQRCSSRVSGSGAVLHQHRRHQEQLVAARAIRRSVRRGAGCPRCRYRRPLRDRHREIQVEGGGLRIGQRRHGREQQPDQ